MREWVRIGEDGCEGMGGGGINPKEEVVSAKKPSKLMNLTGSALRLMFKLKIIWAGML